MICLFSVLRNRIIHRSKKKNVGKTDGRTDKDPASKRKRSQHERNKTPSSPGIFTTTQVTWFISGAPRFNQTGAVCLFQDLPQAGAISAAAPSAILAPPANTPLGSYFGATLAVVDFDADGLDELVVAAPMYSGSLEEGKVFVYRYDIIGLSLVFPICSIIFCRCFN